MNWSKIKWTILNHISLLKIKKYINKKEEQFKKLKKNNKKLEYEYEFFFT